MPSDNQSNDLTGGGRPVPKHSNKDQINLWIQQNNLNKYGDPAGTQYAGGNPLFNEATGTHIKRLDYILQNHPDKPWEALSVVSPSNPSDPGNPPIFSTDPVPGDQLTGGGFGAGANSASTDTSTVASAADTPEAGDTTDTVAGIDTATAGDTTDTTGTLSANVTGADTSGNTDTTGGTSGDTSGGNLQSGDNIDHQFEGQEQGQNGGGVGTGGDTGSGGGTSTGGGGSGGGTGSGGGSGSSNLKTYWITDMPSGVTIGEFKAEIEAAGGNLELRTATTIPPQDFVIAKFTGSSTETSQQKLTALQAHWVQLGPDNKVHIPLSDPGGDPAGTKTFWMTITPPGYTLDSLKTKVASLGGNLEIVPAKTQPPQNFVIIKYSGTNLPGFEQSMNSAGINTRLLDNPNEIKFVASDATTTDSLTGGGLGTGSSVSTASSSSGDTTGGTGGSSTGGGLSSGTSSTGKHHNPLGKHKKSGGLASGTSSSSSGSNSDFGGQQEGDFGGGGNDNSGGGGSSGDTSGGSSSGGGATSADTSGHGASGHGFGHDAGGHGFGHGASGHGGGGGNGLPPGHQDLSNLSHTGVDWKLVYIGGDSKNTTWVPWGGNSPLGYWSSVSDGDANKYGIRGPNPPVGMTPYGNSVWQFGINVGDHSPGGHGGGHGASGHGSGHGPGGHGGVSFLPGGVGHDQSFHPDDFGSGFTPGLDDHHENTA